MDNRTVLRELIVRADHSVIQLLGRLSASLLSWILEEFENQHVWYSRTEYLIDLPSWARWVGNEEENWNQVYNILLASTIEEDRTSNIEEDEHPGVAILDLFDDEHESSLVQNEYNYLGVRLLISWDLLHPYDIDQIRLASAYGETRTLKLIVDQFNIDSSDSVTGVITEAVISASHRGKTESMRLLLDVAKEVNVGMLQIMFTGTLIGYGTTNRPDEVPIRYLYEYIIAQGKREEVFTEEYISETTKQIIYNSRLLALLMMEELQVGIFNIDVDRYDCARMAASVGKVDILQYLLSHQRKIDARSLLQVAIDYGEVEVAKWIVHDKRTEYIDPLPHLKKLLLDQYSPRTSEKDTLLVNILLDIPNSRDHIAHTLSELWESISVKSRETVKRVAVIVCASPNLNLSIVPRDMIRTALDVTVFPRIRALITSISSADYNKWHFEMLLREIVLKRLEPEYYVRWLLSKMNEETTAEEVRDILASAARSVVHPEETIEHVSSNFSAYSNFLLFLLTGRTESDRNNVSQLLKRERVSQEGLEKAILLMQATLVK